MLAPDIPEILPVQGTESRTMEGAGDEQLSCA